MSYQRISTSLEENLEVWGRCGRKGAPPVTGIFNSEIQRPLFAVRAATFFYLEYFQLVNSA